jgi:hypothetical protein
MLPAAPGKWDAQPGSNRLRQIAGALDLPSGVEQVHSIPDPWARPILFWRALFDERHPVHAKIEGEWRGALAIIGLREIRQYAALTVQPIDLAADPQNHSDFRRIIAKLPPSNADFLLPGASWQRFHILRWTGQDQVAHAFALSSPLTLVATGADYRMAFADSDIPWFRNGVLSDPCDDLSSNEKALLAEWLLHIRQSLAGLGAGIQNIGACLEKFARALDSNARGLRPRADVYSNRPIGFTGNALYEVINYPAKPAAAVMTDCAIFSDRNTKSTYVLIDDRVPLQLHTPAKEITVFHTINMDTVRAALPIHDRAIGQLPTSDGTTAFWCSADYFFEDSLLYEETIPLSSGAGANLEAFPGCRPVRSVAALATVRRHAVLPLRAQVLDLLSPDYLERNVSVEWLPSGDCKISLSLEVQRLSPDGEPANTHTVVLERSYTAKEMVRIHTLPAICLWPNFVVSDGTAQANVISERWKSYYLFESWRGLAGDERGFSVAPINGGSNVRDVQIPSDIVGQSDEKCRITVLRSYPEALKCSVESSVPTMPRGGKIKATGLLLLTAPKKIVAPPVQDAVLGIDFGTTGTAIYSAIGSNAPTRMIFKDHNLPITATDPNEFIRVTRDWCLPFKQPPGGQVLSVYQDFGVVGQRMPVRDGHVLFLQDVAGAGFVHGAPNMIRTNLKWSEDKQVNLASQDFLVQLCQQSLAELVQEGVNSVKLCYSYPTAFSDADLGRLSTLWHNVLIRLRDTTSLELTLGDDPAANCEAIAAARYFASGKDNANLVAGRGAISLDIGGGTTDVAVWNRDVGTLHPALLAHLSIKFAGQDVFLEALRRNPSVLSVISNADPEIEGSIAGLERYKGSEAAYNAEIDAIISRYGETLLRNLPAYAETEGVHDLLQIIRLGLSGIAYYIGLQVGQLVAKKVYIPGNNRVPVFVGGNGARLFQWCGDGLATKRFGETLMAGINYACADQLKEFRADTVLTGRPKQEVAYGLVLPPDSLDRPEKNIVPLAGEDYWIGLVDTGDKRSWQDAPDFLALGDKPIMVDPKLENFRQFLKAARIDMNVSESDEVVAAVDREVEVMCRKARELRGRADGQAVRDPVRKLPLFILALRGLVAAKIRAFAKHEFSNLAGV